jgi:GDP/UDP-N,N'-diacetylbacillosamine 2-epimerase (hydrolysing)
MKVAVLTSSRADFGIYLPLLKAIKKDAFFELKLIVFGTHLSSFYGETVNQIIAEGFEVQYKVESMLLTNSSDAISTAMGLTTIKFADFWKNYHSQFDIVFCLGDRFEMFAAVLAGVPFNIKFAHLHGGETTMGAIDNIFRHAITLASKYHFVSTASHGERTAKILGYSDHIYNVGALSLNKLNDINFLTILQFKEKWKVDFSKPTILVTFHPETVAVEKNSYYAAEIVKALKDLNKYQILITMPNADTAGNIVRTALTDNFATSKNVYLIESLGSESYFTAMKHCAFLLGNTSSGIIEAASFAKYVINLGDRQKGRTAGANVIHVPIIAEEILKAVSKINSDNTYKGENIYYQSNSAKSIINALKNI